MVNLLDLKMLSEGQASSDDDDDDEEDMDIDNVAEEIERVAQMEMDRLPQNEEDEEDEKKKKGKKTEVQLRSECLVLIIMCILNFILGVLCSFCISTFFCWVTSC